MTRDIYAKTESPLQDMRHSLSPLPVTYQNLSLKLSK
jgi:hypothetical protein